MSGILAITKEDNLPQRQSSSDLGLRGEMLAADFLEKRGYRLVMANFKVPIGRNTRDAQVTGEVDLIAFDGDVLCFIEVKTRTTDTFAGPLSAVDLRKQRQITRTARIYRRVFALFEIRYRFDVVTVVTRAEPHIELIKGFWNEAKFKKRAWSGEIF